LRERGHKEWRGAFQVLSDTVSLKHGKDTVPRILDQARSGTWGVQRYGYLEISDAVVDDLVTYEIPI
jgi:hypothetical protein